MTTGVESIDYLHINPLPYVPQYSQLGAHYLVGHLLSLGKTGKIISATHGYLTHLLEGQNTPELSFQDLQKPLRNYEDFVAYIQAKYSLKKLLEERSTDTSSLKYIHNHLEHASQRDAETFSGLLAYAKNPQLHQAYPYIINCLLPEIIRENPKVIGLTIADKRQAPFVFAVAGVLKVNSSTQHIPLGVGGYIPSVCAPDIIRTQEHPYTKEIFDYIDFMIHNEGEKPLEEYLKFMEGKIDIGQVPQIIYKENDVIKATSLDTNGRVIPRKMKGLEADDIPRPHFSAELLNQLCMPQGGVVGLLMSRGCIYICSFCAIDKGYNRGAIIMGAMAREEGINREQVNKGVPILKSKEKQLFERLQYYYQNGTKIFSIVDETLTPHSMMEIADLIKKEQIEGISIEFYSTLHSKFLDRNFRQQVARAGFVFPQFGVETISKSALRTSHKFQNLTTIDAQLEIFKGCMEDGIMPHIFLMIGLPNQSELDLVRTIAYLKNISKYVLTIKPTNTKVAKYSQDAIQPTTTGLQLDKAKEFSANIPFQSTGTSDVSYMPKKSVRARKNIFDLRIALRHPYNIFTKHVPYAHRLDTGLENIQAIVAEYNKHKKAGTLPAILAQHDGDPFDLGEKEIARSFGHVFRKLLEQIFSSNQNCHQVIQDNAEQIKLLLHGLILLDQNNLNKTIEFMKPYVSGDLNKLKELLPEACTNHDYSITDLYQELLDLLERFGATYHLTAEFSK